jgi:hypothetical protein
MKNQNIYFANPTVLIAAGFVSKLSIGLRRRLVKLSGMVKTLIITHPAYSSRVAWL